MIAIPPGAWDWLVDLHVPPWFLFLLGGLYWSFARLLKDLKGIGKKQGMFQNKATTDIAKLNTVVTSLAMATNNKELLQFLAQEQRPHPASGEEAN